MRSFAPPSPVLPYPDFPKELWRDVPPGGNNILKSTVEETNVSSVTAELPSRSAFQFFHEVNRAVEKIIQYLDYTEVKYYEKEAFSISNWDKIIKFTAHIQECLTLIAFGDRNSSLTHVSTRTLLSTGYSHIREEFESRFC